MTLLSLFSVGFIMGLTGAMAPGPLLTVTIGESTRRGGIVGPLVVLGHGILEFALLVLIVFGVANFLNSAKVFAGIALAGGIVLIFMGYSAIKGLKGYSLSAEPAGEKQGLHPVLAGIIISLSNPYWFIWWITIGMGYVMFARGLGLQGIFAFFAGHILSDLAWYSFVSYGIQFGGKFLSIRMIKGVLLVCSLFLVLFGIFFIVKGCSFISTNG
ncbi:MAG: LysE type translocator [Syntrophorhabdus sp. PtaU1.Bin002]|nr:MAG: LysE type translocator [Syntrophorhabdus sp. PtaB.Bin006]OPY71454.1 MAG: LysE type translocator [Syntrophorhabdus sp. PtaU1.Bin002]